MRLTQPWPAQEFCPAQLVVAVAQALVPLHELMLKHLPAVSLAEALIGATANRVAAAAASATPVSTANGTTTAYLTKLDQVAIGDIELYDVNATLIESMGVDEILLGMNVLKHFELVQRGDQLIIRQYR